LIRTLIFGSQFKDGQLKSLIFVKEKFVMARVVRKEWFRDWFSSPFYHRLYFERDEREAEEFIHKLVHFLQASPGSRIVDIACGRGRHSCILAKMGFDVTGFDLSFESIDYANQFGSDNLNFYQLRILCYKERT